HLSLDALPTPSLSLKGPLSPLSLDHLLLALIFPSNYSAPIMTTVRVTLLQKLKNNNNQKLGGLRLRRGTKRCYDGKRRYYDNKPTCYYSKQRPKNCFNRPLASGDTIDGG